MESPTSESAIQKIRGLCTEKTFKAITALIFAVFCYQAIRKGLFRAAGNDLDIYLYSSGLFFGGENPYGIEGGLLYPLFAAFVVQPFNYMPLWLAHFLWYAINFGLFIYTLRAAQTRAIDNEFHWVPFGVTFIVLLGIFQNNVLNAQINIIVMSCALAFMVYLKEGKKTLAAFFLAAAVSIKLTPVLFLLYLVVGREFSVLAKTVLFSILFVFILPYLAAGGAVFDFYEVYYDVLFGQISIGHDTGRIFSLGGLVNRLISFRYSYIIIAALSLAAVGGLQYAVNRKVGKISIRVLYLYFLIALLATPISETHHLIWFFPPVLGIISDLYNGLNKGYGTRPMIIALTIFALGYNLSRFLPFGNPVPLLTILLLFAMTTIWTLDEGE